MFMENLLPSNKKGLSEMVSYVLLVAIAIGLSIGVMIYLNLFVPKEKPECPLDTSLLIKDVSCNAIYRSAPNAPLAKTELTLTLYNNGLHNISAAYIRFDTAEKKSKRWINNPILVGDQNFYFFVPATGERGLPPGAERPQYIFTLPSDYKEGNYVLEVQPAIFSKNILSNCQAIIIQNVECKKVILS